MPGAGSLGLQGAFDATDKEIRLEWLAQEAGRAARKSLFLEIWIVTCRDHDHRHRILGSREVLLEFDATHAWHLDVRYDARKARDFSACEELLGRGEAPGVVTGGSHQCHNGAPH